MHNNALWKYIVIYLLADKSEIRVNSYLLLRALAKLILHVYRTSEKNAKISEDYRRDKIFIPKFFILHLKLIKNVNRPDLPWPDHSANGYLIYTRLLKLSIYCFQCQLASCLKIIVLSFEIYHHESFTVVEISLT